jgi:uncharacterized membrane protein YfcA
LFKFIGELLEEITRGSRARVEKKHTDADSAALEADEDAASITPKASRRFLVAGAVGGILGLFVFAPIMTAMLHSTVKDMAAIELCFCLPVNLAFGVTAGAVGAVPGKWLSSVLGWEPDDPGPIPVIVAALAGMLVSVAVDYAGMIIGCAW